MAQIVKNLPIMKENWAWSLGQEHLEWQPTPAFLPGEFYGQRSLVGYSSWSRKRFHFHELRVFLHFFRMIENQKENDINIL